MGYATDPSPVHTFKASDGEDVSAVMSTLHQAYEGNDWVKYYAKDSKKSRGALVEHCIRLWLDPNPAAGGLVSTATRGSVALWFNVPTETSGEWKHLFRIRGVLAGHVPAKRWLPLKATRDHMESKLQEFIEAHTSAFYLVSVATAPELQRQGHATRLLKHMVGAADKTGKWCYTEATSEGSKALLARLHFEVLSRYQVDRKAPPVYLMARKPRPVEEDSDDEGEEGVSSTVYVRPELEYDAEPADSWSFARPSQYNPHY